jgi:hypothetical protein
MPLVVRVYCVKNLVMKYLYLCYWKIRDENKGQTTVFSNIHSSFSCRASTNCSLPGLPDCPLLALRPSMAPISF